MKTILLLLFPVIAYSQSTYTGTVINKITKEKVAFASVGLIKENRGTNADEAGRFTLPAAKYQGDSLIVSCVGFETAKFAVSKLTEDTKLELSEKQAILQPLLLRSNRSSTVLNDFSNCGINAYTSSGFITQVAQHFEAPVPNSLLTVINICKRGDRCRFRIRIYDMDSVTKKPSTDLADSIIEVSSGGRHVSIDLEKYRIIIPGKDFFVAIEWLYIRENESQVKMKVNGEAVKRTEYSPYLFFRQSNSENAGTEVMPEVWQISYDGRWTTFGHALKMLISAKVKY